MEARHPELLATVRAYLSENQEAWGLASSSLAAIDAIVSSEEVPRPKDRREALALLVAFHLPEHRGWQPRDIRREGRVVAALNNWWVALTSSIPYADEQALEALWTTASRLNRYVRGHSMYFSVTGKPTWQEWEAPLRPYLLDEAAVIEGVRWMPRAIRVFEDANWEKDLEEFVRQQINAVMGRNEVFFQSEHVLLSYKSLQRDGEGNSEPGEATLPAEEVWLKRYVLEAALSDRDLARAIKIAVCAYRRLESEDYRLRLQRCCDWRSLRFVPYTELEPKVKAAVNAAEYRQHKKRSLDALEQAVQECGSPEDLRELFPAAGLQRSSVACIYALGAIELGEGAVEADPSWTSADSVAHGIKELSRFFGVFTGSEPVEATDGHGLSKHAHVLRGVLQGALHSDPSKLAQATWVRFEQHYGGGAPDPSIESALAEVRRIVEEYPLNAHAKRCILARLPTLLEEIFQAPSRTR